MKFGDQLDLLEPTTGQVEHPGDEPAFLAHPHSLIEWDFKRFHEKHPHVYAELERMALRWAAHGAVRVGIARLAEAVRYSTVRTDDTLQFKINNNHRSLYARLLIHRHAHLRELIETRRRREPDATQDTGDAA